MKLLKNILIGTSILSSVALLSCGGSKKDKKFDYEVAMDNFERKINDCNYVIEGDDFKTNVFSDDLVLFEYERYGYNDFVAMSVDNEVFQSYIKNNSLANIQFVKYGTAVNACTYNALLPNYFVAQANGNMFDLFYNMNEEDGKYISNDTTVKDFIQKTGGYSDIVWSSMEEVYLTLDSENPSNATLKTHVYNAVSRLDFDIEMTIKFGNATANAKALEWMNNPIMPSSPTSWSVEQEGTIDQIFNLYQSEESGQGIPFIDGSSYALYLNFDYAKYYDTVLITDKHSSENVYNNYITKLVNLGFNETIVDGEVCYRKPLRVESYGTVYSEIYVDYDMETLEIEASEYYEAPTYDNIDNINSLLTTYGYSSLDSNQAISSVFGQDIMQREYESYIYLNEYEFVMIVELEFNNPDVADTYLGTYLEKLEGLGFMYQAKSQDQHYISEDGLRKVWYVYDFINNKITFKFKSNRNYSNTEINSLIEENSFAALDFTNVERFTAKDNSKYDLIVSNKNYEFDLDVDLYFEDFQTLNDVMTEYFNNLSALGFTQTSESQGTGKDIEFIKDNYVFGFKYKQSETSNDIVANLTFVKK